MLAPDYKISEQESNEASSLYWLDFDKYMAMSEDERDTIMLLMDADKLGWWPVTVSEVHEQWERDEQESERRRTASWVKQ